MKIMSIIGARPQLIKAAAVSPALRARHSEVLVHTGQHYDDRMSSDLFAELGIPEPDVNLGVGSGSHGRQTAAMLAGLEELMLETKPDCVLIYGDTNSTVAGALAAAKLNVPIAHVEAGLRSFNRHMPEEVNRVVADHLSSLLFCPTETAVRNLAKEGIVRGVVLVGDVMLDTLEAMSPAIRTAAPARAFGLKNKQYAVATIHRAENTDDPQRLASILSGLCRLGIPVLFPVHPRTSKAIADAGLALPANLVRCEPLGYVDMIAAVRDARVVVTDSGGLQKEAFWMRTPCVTVRDETEWLETVESGWNVLVGADADRILAAAAAFARASVLSDTTAAQVGASALIVRELEAFELPARS